MHARWKWKRDSCDARIVKQSNKLGKFRSRDWPAKVVKKKKKKNTSFEKNEQAKMRVKMFVLEAGKTNFN